MCTPTSGQKSKRKRQVSSPPSIPGGREEKGGVGVYQLAADTPTAGKKSKRKKQVSSPPSIPGGREEKGGVGVYQPAADVYTHLWSEE